MGKIIISAQYRINFEIFFNEILIGTDGDDESEESSNEQKETNGGYKSSKNTSRRKKGTNDQIKESKSASHFSSNGDELKQSLTKLLKGNSVSGDNASTSSKVKAIPHDETWVEVSKDNITIELGEENLYKTSDNSYSNNFLLFPIG